VGYRHIMIRHGFGPQDEEDTEAALRDPAPTLRYPSTQEWLFKSRFTMPDGAGGTVQCARVVAVEFKPYPRPDPKPKGIVNAFYGRVL
jgi:hypothetical protein